MTRVEIYETGCVISLSVAAVGGMMSTVECVRDVDWVDAARGGTSWEMDVGVAHPDDGDRCKVGPFEIEIVNWELRMRERLEELESIGSRLWETLKIVGSYAGSLAQACMDSKGRDKVEERKDGQDMAEVGVQASPEMISVASVAVMGGPAVSEMGTQVSPDMVCVASMTDMDGYVIGRDGRSAHKEGKIKEEAIVREKVRTYLEEKDERKVVIGVKEPLELSLVTRSEMGPLDCTVMEDEDDEEDKMIGAGSSRLRRKRRNERNGNRKRNTSRETRKEEGRKETRVDDVLSLPKSGKWRKRLKKRVRKKGGPNGSDMIICPDCHGSGRAVGRNRDRVIEGRGRHASAAAVVGGSIRECNGFVPADDPWPESPVDVLRGYKVQDGVRRRSGGGVHRKWGIRSLDKDRIGNKNRDLGIATFATIPGRGLRGSSSDVAEQDLLRNRINEFEDEDERYAQTGCGKEGMRKSVRRGIGKAGIECGSLQLDTKCETRCRCDLGWDPDTGLSVDGACVADGVSPLDFDPLDL
ncbi:hypothetical protein EAI_03317 [Harpegnathos saltator]|uniref:Uncharacterized protein n=1 Tax=Harpegnathos saltator TaxID=610380 RepID=E2BPY7_HARSA|nr:hypothetical protein EAI_03317 [Harpegnathos saltator]